MKAITQDLNFSGIYCIINIKNSKRYIGSSKNIRQRLWTHRACLRHNNHENAHLQAAWNKYGEGVHNRRFYLEKLDKAPIVIKKPNSLPKTKIYVISDNEFLQFIGWKSAASYFNVSIANIKQYNNKKLRFKKKYKVTTILPCN